MTEVVPIRTNSDDDPRAALEDVRMDLQALAREVGKRDSIRLTGIGGNSSSRVAAVTSSLTPGRVVYVGAGPILTDDADFTFASNALTLGAATGTNLVVSSTTASTTTTSGCALFGGGVGVAGRLCAGSVLGANLTSGRLPLVSTGGLISNDAAHLWGSTTLTVGDGGASAYSIRLDSAAAQRRTFSFLTGGLDRWGMRADNDTESGSDSGSSWRLVAFDDTGTTIDSPIIAVRATGGIMTLSRPVTLATTSSGLTIAKTTGTTLTVSSTQSASSATTGAAIFSGGIGVSGAGYFGLSVVSGTTTTAAGFIANGPSASGFGYEIYSAGVLRWQIIKTGAQFLNIAAFNSGGTLIDVPMTFDNASGGAITIVRPVTISAASLTVSRGTMAAATQGIGYTGTTTATSGNTWGMLAVQTINPAGASTANISGIAGNATISSTSGGNSGGIIGLDGALDANATANTFASLSGLRGTVRVGGAGQTITNLYAINASISTSANAAIGTRRGVYVSMVNAGASVITTDYGIYIENVNNAATNYAIFTNLGLCRFGDTTASTTTTSGSGTFAGGVGVAGAINVGGPLSNFSSTTNGANAVNVTNGSNGVNAVARCQLINDSTSALTLDCYGSAATGTRFSITRLNYAGVIAEGASVNGLLIGCQGVDKPIILGINVTEVARFTSTGLDLKAAAPLKIAGVQVLTSQGALVADASGGATIDTEARTAINTLLARCRAHGFIAT